MPEITDEQYNLISPYFAESTQESESESMTFVATLRGLPASIRAFLLSIDTAIAILALGQEYSLTNQQLSILARAIRGFVTGELTLGNMVNGLQSWLGVNSHVAANIADEVIQKVVRPVLGDVKKIQSERPESQPSTRFNPGSPPKIQPAPGLYPKPPAPPPSYPGQMDVNPDNVIDLRNQQP